MVPELDYFVGATGIVGVGVGIGLIGAGPTSLGIIFDGSCFSGVLELVGTGSVGFGAGFRGSVGSAGAGGITVGVTTDLFTV